MSYGRYSYQGPSGFRQTKKPEKPEMGGNEHYVLTLKNTNMIVPAYLLKDFPNEQSAKAEIERNNLGDQVEAKPLNDKIAAVAFKMIRAESQILGDSKITMEIEPSEDFENP